MIHTYDTYVCIYIRMYVYDTYVSYIRYVCIIHTYVCIYIHTYVCGGYFARVIHDTLPWASSASP